MVFGGSPLNTLKLSLAKFVLFFISVYGICIFYHFKTFLPKVCWSCQYKWLIIVRHLGYKKVFLAEHPKTRFSDIKKIQKSHKNNKISFFFKVLSDLVWQLLILFNSWRCCDPSVLNDVLNKLTVPDWLCGGLIHIHLSSFMHTVNLKFSSLGCILYIVYILYIV